MLTAEQQARVVIDRLLTAAGWVVQDVKAADVHAGRDLSLLEDLGCDLERARSWLRRASAGDPLLHR